MFRKNNTLINNQGGAIIVEFAFVTFIIVLFIKLLIAIAEYQSISGKLDRLSYSAAVSFVKGGGYIRMILN